MKSPPPTDPWVIPYLYLGTGIVLNAGTFADFNTIPPECVSTCHFGDGGTCTAVDHASVLSTTIVD